MIVLVGGSLFDREERHSVGGFFFFLTLSFEMFIRDIDGCSLGDFDGSCLSMIRGRLP
jgi:hypothetical protein